MHNKYISRSRISEYQFRRLIRMFTIDMEATKITALTGLNRNTVNRILKLLCTRLAKLCEQENTCRKGIFELDECYLGARKVRGKRTKGKTILFGIYERAFRQIIDNVKRENVYEDN